ncbi:MAG: transglutaminase domain-containing protein [Eubacteriales bacterium]|jgi:hypothetical protein
MRQGYRIFTVTLVLAVLAGIVIGCSTTTGLYIGKDGTYYRGEDGKNHIGFLQTDEGIRYFGEDGRMVKDGIVEIDGFIYGFENGIMVTGWYDIELGTYYFDDSGRAVTGKQLIDGKEFLFDDDTCVLIGEVSEPNDEEPTSEPVEPSPTPSSTPSESPSPTPDTTPEPTEPSAGNEDKSAAVGELTGNDRLDKEVKKVIDEVCDPDKDAEYNLGQVFDWMVKELKYKYVTVDLSNGYTEDLVIDLAEFVVLHRRGSCEHQAALMAVFARRLGHEAIVMPGEFLSDDRTEWVEHAWVIAKVNDSYYHFDPLYGRNHTGGRPRTFFMKKDADIEDVHRWDREAYPACE